MIRYARKLGIAAAAIVGVVLPTSASAQTTMSLGTWYEFRWFDGEGPVDDPASGFFLSILESAELRIVECCITGDAFDIYINSVLAFSTPSVPTGFFGNSGTPDQAWADARLSKASIFLAPGDYDIEIFVRESAVSANCLNGDCLTGAGYLRADPTVVPEPLSFVLLGTGLFGVGGLAARRRKRQTKHAVA